MARRTRQRELSSQVALGAGLVHLVSLKSSASGFGEKVGEPGVSGLSLLPWAVAWHSTAKLSLAESPAESGLSHSLAAHCCPLCASLPRRW